MNIKDYIIKKEDAYDYFDVFSYIKDFIYFNHYYHLSCKDIAKLLYDEIDVEIPHTFHYKFLESSVEEYMNNNKELFLVIGGQE